MLVLRSSLVSSTALVYQNFGCDVEYYLFALVVASTK